MLARALGLERVPCSWSDCRSQISSRLYVPIGTPSNSIHVLAWQLLVFRLSRISRLMCAVFSKAHAAQCSWSIWTKLRRKVCQKQCYSGTYLTTINKTSAGKMHHDCLCFLGNIKYKTQYQNFNEKPGYATCGCTEFLPVFFPNYGKEIHTISSQFVLHVYVSQACEWGVLLYTKRCLNLFKLQNCGNTPDRPTYRIHIRLGSTETGYRELVSWECSNSFVPDSSIHSSCQLQLQLQPYQRSMFWYVVPFNEFRKWCDWIHEYERAPKVVKKVRLMQGN